MDNVMKLIVIGAGLIMTGVVLFAAVNLTNLGSSVSRGLSDSINDKNVSIENAEFTQYESVVCTGSDVVSAIRKYKEEMPIVVHGFSADGSNFEFDSSTASSFQNYPTNHDYINPSAEFNCTLNWSSNGNVMGMEFQQIEFVSSYVPTSLHGHAEESISLLEDEANTMPSMVTSTQFSSPEDVTIVFSTGEEKLENTNDSIVIEDLARVIAVNASKLDDIMRGLEAFDLEEDGESELNNAYMKLKNLELEIVSVKDKCKEEMGEKEEVREVREKLKAVVRGVEEAKVSIKSLREQLKAVENTDTTWWIGFPISVDVKAELKKGTLTLSGEGEISLERGEIPWLKRAESIERVKIEAGVLVDNVDYWFSGCGELEEVEGIPETVSSANGTFEGCAKLKEVKLPGGIVSANGIGEKGTVFVVPEDSTTQKTFEELSGVSDVDWR